MKQDEIELAFAMQTFVHSAEKANAESIKKTGLGASGNPVTTRGIYTFTEDDAREMFHRSAYDHYHIRLKPGSKILYTDSDRPMDYLIGNFDSPFKKVWEKIIKETGLSGPGDVMALFGRGDEWFEWKAKFHRAVEKHLAENGYAGIQEGGQTVITDLSSIESVKLNGKPVEVDSVRQYKHGQLMQ